MRTDILERKEEILTWIRENKPKCDMCKEINCKPDTLNSYLIKMDIVYKGFSQKGRNTGIGYKPAMYYIENNKNITSHKLKIKLIRDGVKEHKCEVCNTSKWMDKEIPLELDHIDGDHYNNKLVNLRIICPNCHAQTDTNSGKNIGKKV